MSTPPRLSALVFTLVLGACGGDDKGPSTSQTSEGDGFTCEPAGGMCQCAGGCATGSVQDPMLTCPQPPDSAGACSLECCVPSDATTATGTSTTATTTTPTTGGACVCADLPACTTPENEDCGGMYPTGQCCDAGGAPFHCACIEPCTGGYPCCVLSAGCA